MKNRGRKPSILIGVPIGPSPDKRFLESLPAFLKECEGHYDLELIQVSNKALVDAQNYIADYFLKGSKDYLLLMEDDHWGHSRNMLKALLRTNAPISGINYYSRHFPYYTCLMQKLEGYDKDNEFGHMAYDKGYYECALIGYAMMLIKREVFEKLDTPYFRLNECDDPESFATDISFCNRVRKAGLKLIGCFDYILAHRDITKENRMQKMIDDYDIYVSKPRKEFLKKKGFIV
jgi:hypothetical protein